MTEYTPSRFNARCRPSRGQALVEAALVMPVLIFAFMAMAELAFLVSASFAWQRGADVLAQSAAIRSYDPDWRERWDVMADEEQARANCGEPTVDFLDGTDAGGRVEVSWSCEYGFQLINGMTFPATRVESVAVIPAP